LAWGFENGGRDDENDGKVVIVDHQVGASEIQRLKAKGKTVICYLSTGTWEPFRSDASDPRWSSLKAAKMGDWDEYWLDIRKLDELGAVMGDRIQQALQDSCDGLEPDNVDCYQNSRCRNAMGLSEAAAKPYQLEYNCWQVRAARQRGLVIGLKNSMGLLSELGSFYNFAVNEQCRTYSECGDYSGFSKPVFAVEYLSQQDFDNRCGSGGACKQAAAYGPNFKRKVCVASSSDGGLCAKDWVNCWQEPCA
jgi:hypothetical protein